MTPRNSYLPWVQKRVLNGSQNRTNPFAAARCDKSAMRPFAKLLLTLVYVTTRNRYGFNFYETSHNLPQLCRMKIAIDECVVLLGY